MGGIRQSGLFKSLPISIQDQVYLDMYWFALEQVGLINLKFNTRHGFLFLLLPHLFY